MYYLMWLCSLTKMIIVIHWSIRSWTNSGPPGPKLTSNAPLNIESFFVWSKNVVESSKVVLLVGFSLVSINLQCENCLSKPFASESRLFTIKLNTSTKTRVFCWKDLTLHVQMPHPWAWTVVNCPWVSRGGGEGEGCWSDCDRRLRYAVDGVIISHPLT